MTPAAVRVGQRTLGQLEGALPAIELRLGDALVPPGSAVVNFHNTAGWIWWCAIIAGGFHPLIH